MTSMLNLRSMSDSQKHELTKLGYSLIVDSGFSLTVASERLGISRSTLRRYLNKYIADSKMKAKLNIAIQQCVASSNADIVREAELLHHSSISNSVISFAEAADKAARELPASNKRHSRLR